MNIIYFVYANQFYSVDQFKYVLYYMLSIEGKFSIELIVFIKNYKISNQVFLTRKQLDMILNA